MPEADLFLLFVRRLNELALPYVVTGSVAGVIYGEPRVTHDVDVVLDAKPGDSERIAKMFPLEDFYCPPLEVLEEEARRRQRGHYNLIHHRSGFKADVYVAGADRLHAWALDDRYEVELEGVRVPVAPLEYVVVRKLEFFREGRSEKHLLDIRSMLRVSAARVRRPVLLKWIATLGVQEAWREVGVDIAD
ncbi:MAG: hypothetical protein AAF645_21525 [Myxococcota bacterium]